MTCSFISEIQHLYFLSSIYISYNNGYVQFPARREACVKAEGSLLTSRDCKNSIDQVTKAGMINKAKRFCI